MPKNFDCSTIVAKDGNLFVNDVQISRIESLPGKEKYGGEYATSGDAQDILKSLITDQDPKVCGARDEDSEDFSAGDVELGVWHTRDGVSLIAIGITGTPVEYLLASYEGEGRENAATAEAQRVAIAIYGEELGQDNFSEQWG
jgi:hypothetical protein